MASEIYKILESVMSERNLTVADVARLCELADSTVRGITTRKQSSVSLEVAFRLSRGLAVSLEYLNGDTDDPRVCAAKKTNDKGCALSVLQRISFLCNELNDEGQVKVEDYAQDLVDSGKYKKGIPGANKVEKTG